MAVLGVSCNWGARRVSYAILEGTKDNPRIDVGDLKLSEDTRVTSIDNLVEIANKMSDLCKIHSIEKACLFSPSGWEKPMKRPEWRSPDPMKFRIETAAALSIRSSRVPIEIKNTKKIASDLGLNLKGDLRKNIQSSVDRRFSVTNNDQRDAVAAALSILD